jgi:thioredoxin reductase (NADPH)
MLTSDVENFPGYPDGVLGPVMMEEFRKQAERFGTQIRYQTVTGVELLSNPKKLILDESETITADTVIIATGASAKWLGLPSEKRLYGAGVSACAVCDGFFYKNKPVAVVGGGDTAAEEATYLAKMCSEVHLLVRRDVMRASKIMQSRLMNTPNITIHWNTETVDILGDKAVTGVAVRNTKTQAITELSVSGFFVAIGHEPNTQLFKGIIEMDENGYIITKGKTTYTNVAGVFAAGDVQDNMYRQAVSAAGSGCMAALDAERWLASQGH